MKQAEVPEELIKMKTFHFLFLTLQRIGCTFNQHKITTWN